MNVNDLTIGQVKELINLVGRNKPAEEIENLGWQIIVLQRGWVYVGEVSRAGDFYEVVNGACIRRWGTTRGLGQLANEGPTPDTALEQAPLIRFHEAGKILLIQTKKELWNSK